MRILDPSSAEAQELRKWEQHPTRFALDENGDMRPGNPYVFRPYPKMVYKALKIPQTGKVICMMPQPDIYDYTDMASYERAGLRVDALNRQCYKLVHSDAEWQRAKDDGWRSDATQALEQYEAYEQAIGNAGAGAAAAVPRISAQAKDEKQAADNATHQHVTDVTSIPSTASASERRRGSKGVVADPSLSE